ncbi:hypothetical protein [Arthrobacter sp. NA-172]|uniref:hypothetical protein n=1 Tax=Arthrobacter sp. NA-172 TaxID=3367524 RepID=UPI003754C80D
MRRPLKSKTAPTLTEVAEPLPCPAADLYFTRARDEVDNNSTPVAPNRTVSFQVGGVSGIPTTVSAVTLRLTVANPTSFGFVTAYPSGTARPNASNLNYAAGQIVPKLVTVPAGADGKVTLYSASSGTTQLITEHRGPRPFVRGPGCRAGAGQLRAYDFEG